MADLAPIQDLVFFLRAQLISGDSMLMAIEKFCVENNNREAMDLQNILWISKTGGKYEPSRALSPQRRLLYKILWDGLAGQPAVELLNKLEPEIHRQCQIEMAQFIKSLPIKVTFIIMGICVPALLLLFFSLFIEVFLSGGIL